jgi:phospholipid-binding lipoprotein MlaA
MVFNINKKIAMIVLGVLCALPAHADDNVISDPFESYNRAIFKFNDAFDQHIVLPVIKGYQAVVPKPARTGVHNALTNLKSPVTIANQILQGDFGGAGQASVRMIVNTLVGFGGLMDVAAAEGIKHEPEDFGQTLAVWGVGNGPYVVPPILPPTTLRDGTAALVDMYADPVGLWMRNTDRDGLAWGVRGASIVDARSELSQALADLRKNSIDYYATIRSAYYQRRAAEIGDAKRPVDADIPNY